MNLLKLTGFSYLLSYGVKATATEVKSEIRPRFEQAKDSTNPTMELTGKSPNIPVGITKPTINLDYPANNRAHNLPTGTCQDHYLLLYQMNGLAKIHAQLPADTAILLVALMIYKNRK